jgi:hypothetical protein
MFGRLQLITTSISASIGTRPPSLNTPLPIAPVLGHDASFLGTSLLPIYRYNSIQSQVQDSDSEEEGGRRLEFGSFLSRDYTFHTLFPCTATATYSKRSHYLVGRCVFGVGPICPCRSSGCRHRGPCVTSGELLG